MYEVWQKGSATLLFNGGCGNEEAQIAVSGYLDGEADPAEQILAESHLRHCRACQRLQSQWSLNTARIRSAGHDMQMERLAGAIADQTRDWLFTQLQAVSRPQPTHRFAPRLAFGTAMASLIVFLSVLGLGLSPLTSSASGPFTVGVTTASSTTGIISPALLVNSQSPLRATPSVKRGSLAGASFDLHPLLVPENATPVGSSAAPAPLTPTGGVVGAGGTGGD